ncbi:PASTA domain-containing protein [Barnesiella viscericola]|uniref:PASTA domain-containing protein n=1 Tax=Barnesiella viscericola TaxID=397865 RepID=A0A921SUP1_9BACT|nr:PASTA domain-containing protein [Barnesiella viscericola]HJG88896.1 PASTA domain-containing protein [Barnesiella viscericola]
MGKLMEFFKKHPIIKTLVQMVIVFFLLIAITLYGLKLYTRHGKAVLVPDVKAMALPDALRILDREGFRYDIIDSLFVDEAVPGTIVEQTPAGGSKVKEGRIVYLSINAYSPRMITCPKVADMSMRQALSTLESRGLTDIKVQEVPSEYPDLALGLQYRGETLEAGDKIPAGSTVTLLVGNGMPETYSDSTFEETPQTTEEAPLTDESWFN